MKKDFFLNIQTNRHQETGIRMEEFHKEVRRSQSLIKMEIKNSLKRDSNKGLIMDKIEIKEVDLIIEIMLQMVATMVVLIKAGLDSIITIMVVKEIKVSKDKVKGIILDKKIRL